MHSFTETLVEELVQSADAKKAVAMKAYMKNQFEFLGITTPERRKILKLYLQQNAIKDQQELQVIVKKLWTLPQREFQYCAIEILLLNKKSWEDEIIELIEFCITSKSWWDTVDPLSYDCAGSYFRKFSDSTTNITGSWNRSGNTWLQRGSLLFQKSYKRETNTNLLSTYIVNLASSKEFFLQKAIGWILREYAKTDPTWVQTFVSQHKLPHLSHREAMKHLSAGTAEVG